MLKLSIFGSKLNLPYEILKIGFGDYDEERQEVNDRVVTNNGIIPLVKIDKKLNRFKGKVLFKKKLDRANKLLENADLSKIVKAKNHSHPTE